MNARPRKTGVIAWFGREWKVAVFAVGLLVAFALFWHGDIAAGSALLAGMGTTAQYWLTGDKLQDAVKKPATTAPKPTDPPKP